MTLLERIAARQTAGRKHFTAGGGQGFTQEPFWSSDLRLPLWTSSTLASNEEKIENDLDAYVRRAYKADGIVFACIAARQHIFSQARFAWRRYANQVPGDLFGNRELRLLERPAPGQTTGNLLARMEVMGSLAGNHYATVADDAGRVGRRATGPGRRIAELRPSWVTIIGGSASGDPNAADARIVGYLYEPVPAGGGASPRSAPLLLTPSEVSHYAPEPDPEARWRGMSWLTPILREIQADKAATVHKQKFFENGATPGIAIKFDKDTDQDAFDEFVEKFREYHEGAWNAYKTLFLAAGADVVPVGMDLRQLDFKQTQGGGETRIASAAGMHPVIVALSEGLQGSSLNQGNFAAARRLVADKTMRHLWAEAASSLATLLTSPGDDVFLEADLRNVAFLREDQRDVAEIQQSKAGAIRQLVDAGFDPDAAVEYALTDDLSVLRRRHSGLFSVQLQPPATESQLEDAVDQGPAGVPALNGRSGG